MDKLTAEDIIRLKKWRDEVQFSSGVAAVSTGDFLALVDTAEEAERLRLEKGVLQAQIHMTVSRLGGKVEDAPTSELNFLQRVDELVAKEAENARLRAALEPLAELWDDEIRACGYDDNYHPSESSLSEEGCVKFRHLKRAWEALNGEK